MCCGLIEGGGVGRKDRLIADQRCEAANPLDVDWLRVCACGVAVALLCGKAADAEARKPIAIRNILTEGDEMMFVVDGCDLARGTEECKRVKEAGAVKALDADHHGHIACGVRDHFQRGLGAPECPRYGGLGPDDQIGAGPCERGRARKGELALKEDGHKGGIPLLMLGRVGLDQAHERRVRRGACVLAYERHAGEGGQNRDDR